MITTFKTPTDFRKSLEARLKSVATKNNQDLQRIRRKVAFDRLLARIFHQDTNNFVLKGGYAMELRFATARATKDIDLTCIHRTDSSDTTIEELIAIELRKLIRIDLKDYFSFEIGLARMDLENAPYGGARYSVSSFVDHRIFVRFQLDVGADVVVDEIEQMQGEDWLNYCGVDAPVMRMISIEQQLAEKFHAYTLPREQRWNSRVKDVVDMLLLTQFRQIDMLIFKNAIQRVYQVRGTHPLSDVLPPPPPEWIPVYETLAAECGLTLNMDQAYNELSHFYRLLEL